MKTLSGDLNLNRIPRMRLMTRQTMSGSSRFPTMTSHQLAGQLLAESPVDFAWYESKPKTIGRQNRPYGVF
jgi:endonuclease/exonuclease/phosphatase (EEP) superfamily protein YafD